MRRIGDLVGGSPLALELAAAWIGTLSPAEIEEKFDLGYHTKHVDTIFRRVFGEA